MIYNSTFIWFSLIFFFLFLEMGHPGLLYFLSFSCGALCALLGAIYGMCVPIQLTLFLAGTCGALLLVYVYSSEKKNQLQSSTHRSNLDALIGKKVVLMQSPDNSLIWQTRVSGQVWLVRPVDSQLLESGQTVVIVDVQGCHLRVDRITKTV